ncbi:unnamed protein product [Paramecium pentaurelia]|uniref:Uncharacterized protein n=1 Tax=Paramecium pentaurelia TaxID=43138 RepID=A0A8S1S057_9CILI|nr:unnamed protein product [Paramecium pentaurelia]
MNKSEFLNYKKNLKIREQSSSNTLWLVIYVCLIYLLFGSFNICGKFFLTCTYIYSFSDNFSVLNYRSLNLANFQQLNIQRYYRWFLFEMVGPLSLPLIPDIIGRMKFKFIFLIASLGPILFLTPALYASLCKDSGNSGCNTLLIYCCAFVVSIIAGLMQSLLLFVMLFYLSNLAKSREKVIYYGSFFLIHSLQWLLGSLIGEIFITYDNMNTRNTISKVFGILIIMQFSISLIYLTIPENYNGRYYSFQKTLIQFYNQKSQKQSKMDSNQQDIRELLLKSSNSECDDNDVNNTFYNTQQNDKCNEKQQQTDLHLFTSQLLQNSNTKSILTLQCFSIEERSLIELLESSQSNQNCSNFICIDEYQNRSYFSKLYITLDKLYKDGFSWVLFLLCFIASIQSFLYIYFFPFFAQPGTKQLTIQAAFVLQGYLYVGVGELFGSFGIGMLGESKDKINALIYILYIFQFGCLVAWASYLFQYEILILVFSITTGFCDSSMTSTVISVLTLRFPKYIYLVDLMYFIYSLSFAALALIFISCNFDNNTFLSLILLQTIGLLGLFAVYKINHLIENNQIQIVK